MKCWKVQELKELKFNGVDLGDFQELLDFETPESREEVLQEVKRLKG